MKLQIAMKERLKLGALDLHQRCNQAHADRGPACGGIKADGGPQIIVNLALKYLQTLAMALLCTDMLPSR